MSNLQTPKKAWAPPQLTVHGKVQEITQTKYKTYGSGDDVILCIPDAPSLGSCPPDATC